MAPPSSYTRSGSTNDNSSSRAINLRAEGGHVAHRVLNRRHSVLQVGEHDAGTLFQDGIGVGEGSDDSRRRVRVQHLLVDRLNVVDGGVLGGDLRLQPFLPLQQQQRLLSASAGQCLSGLLAKGVRFFGEAVHLCFEQLPRGLHLDQRNVRLVDGCFTASSTFTAAADLDDANAVIEGHRLQSGARLRLGHLNDYGETGLVEWPPGKEGLVQLGGKVVVAQAGARLDGRGSATVQAFQVALDALHQQVQRLTAEELRFGVGVKEEAVEDFILEEEYCPLSALSARAALELVSRLQPTESGFSSSEFTDQLGSERPRERAFLATGNSWSVINATRRFIVERTRSRQSGWGSWWPSRRRKARRTSSRLKATVRVCRHHRLMAFVQKFIFRSQPSGLVSRTRKGLKSTAIRRSSDQQSGR
ncbi:hypothetical protein TYRP_017544 [Tyrophagus putrescentiae]|nr:hypothetical protein TYRP_017544 [Tyrophagus putrescentiae]